MTSWAPPTMGDGLRPLVVIPVKSFADGKGRLAAALDDQERDRLARALASHTAVTVRDAGADVIIVAGSDHVMEWAHAVGLTAARQRDDSPGLNRAAATGCRVAFANDRRAFVLHADLPWIDAPTVRRALATPGIVLAPSYDGGTALIGGIEPGFPFAYGPASFHRHLAAAPQAAVITAPAFALDLDLPSDLGRARASQRGRWLERYLPQPSLETVQPV